MNSQSAKESLVSPCINICSLDEEEICMGCFRHIDEIRLWSKTDIATQQKILANIEQRKVNGGY